MSVFVDLQCSHCGKILEDRWSDEIGDDHEGCDGAWERLWSLTKGPDPGTHPSERCVVYYSTQEKKIQYPGQNDVPVPERLRRRGYEKLEIHVPQLGAFEKKHGVKNERRHWDRNGRGIED